MVISCLTAGLVSNSVFGCGSALTLTDGFDRGSALCTRSGLDSNRRTIFLAN